MGKRKFIILAVVSLIICFISGYSGKWFQSAANASKTQEIFVPTNFGTLSGKLYKPNSATSAAKKQAAVISLDDPEGLATELAKRGVVVFAVDLYGRGKSELMVRATDEYFDTLKANAAKKYPDAADSAKLESLKKIYDDAKTLPDAEKLYAFNAAGLYDAVAYVNTLNYITADKIHVLAGAEAEYALMFDNLQTKQAITSLSLLNVSPAVAEKQTIGGKDYFYSELYGKRSVAVLNSDAAYLKSDEAIAFVNSVAAYDKDGNRTGTAEEAVKDGMCLEDKDDAKGVYVGIYSGVVATKKADGTFEAASTAVRAVFDISGVASQEGLTNKTVEAAIQFLGKSDAAFTGANRAENTSWWFGMALNIVGAAALMCFIFAMVMVIIGMPVFNKKEAACACEGAAVVEGEVQSQAAVEPADAAPAKAEPAEKKPVNFLGLLVALVGGIGLSILFFFIATRISPLNANRFFSQPATSQLLLYMLFMSVIGLGLVFIGKLFEGSDGASGKLAGMFKNGTAACWKKTLGYLAAAFAVFALAYGVIYLVNYMWATEFAVWSLRFNTFGAATVGVFLKYLVFFAVFFAVSGLIIYNFNYFTGRLAWLNTLFAVLFNAGGIALFLLFAGNANAESLAVTAVPLFALSALVSKKFNDATGSVWLGTFVNSFFFTMLVTAASLTVAA